MRLLRAERDLESSFRASFRAEGRDGDAPCFALTLSAPPPPRRREAMRQLFSPRPTPPPPPPPPAPPPPPPPPPDGRVEMLTRRAGQPMPRSVVLLALMGKSPDPRHMVGFASLPPALASFLASAPLTIRPSPSPRPGRSEPRRVA